MIVANRRPRQGLIVAARRSGRPRASITCLLELLWCRVCGRPTASTLTIEGCLAAVALDVHFDDCGVVYEAVDGRQRHGLVGKDATPLAEWLVGRNQQRALLVAGRN